MPKNNCKQRNSKSLNKRIEGVNKNEAVSNY
jgi:hypothetical protein